MNLIEQLGGYEWAKIIQGSREMGGLPYDLDLEDALLQYRRQHNIFEPDDYIIHDGELKVFARWSSAVEGCAYIGYAYAENGEMAHKDEFRHATDEEIKAGRRLSKIKCWSCDKEMSHSDRAENDGFCIHCNAEIEL